MKKIFITLIAISIIGVACQKEFEPGQLNTFDFAGDWYYQLKAADGSLYYDIDDTYPNTGGGLPFLTYNSAANKANELWFDDQGWDFPVKAKFTLAGTPENFSAGMAVNERVLTLPAVPLANRVDGMQVVLNRNTNYYLAEIIEGKILKDAAVVDADVQKARTDSIYVKFAFHGADFHVTVKRNIKVDTVDRIVPTIPPTDSVTYDTSFVYMRDADFFDVLDPMDTLIITGHRQTGWEVDF